MIIDRLGNSNFMPYIFHFKGHDQLCINFADLAYNSCAAFEQCTYIKIIKVL